MKPETIAYAFSDIDDQYIRESHPAAVLAAKGVLPRAEGPVRRFLGSGWGVAAISVATALLVLGGILYAGRMAGDPHMTPGGTPGGQPGDTIESTNTDLDYPDVDRTEPTTPAVTLTVDGTEYTLLGGHLISGTLLGEETDGIQSAIHMDGMPPETLENIRSLDCGSIVRYTDGNRFDRIKLESVRMESGHAEIESIKVYDGGGELVREGTDAIRAGLSDETYFAVLMLNAGGFPYTMGDTVYTAEDGCRVAVVFRLVSPTFVETVLPETDPPDTGDEIDPGYTQNPAPIEIYATENRTDAPREWCLTDVRYHSGVLYNPADPEDRIDRDAAWWDFSDPAETKNACLSLCQTTVTTDSTIIFPWQDGVTFLGYYIFDDNFETVSTPEYALENVPEFIHRFPDGEYYVLLTVRITEDYPGGAYYEYTPGNIYCVEGATFTVPFKVVFDQNAAAAETDGTDDPAPALPDVEPFSFRYSIDAPDGYDPGDTVTVHVAMRNDTTEAITYEGSSSAYEPLIWLYAITESGHEYPLNEGMDFTADLVEHTYEPGVWVEATYTVKIPETVTANEEFYLEVYHPFDSRYAATFEEVFDNPNG